MIPCATVAQLTMPPKMLTRMPSTLGSESRILKAATTAGVVTPPPRSRKLAGSPPLSLMMSMVAMARPAPLTRHAMLPSRLMKLRSCAAACTSRGSSWEVSRCSWMAFWRKSALSSKLTLASTATTLPSGVSVKGLTSTIVQSHLVKVLYKASMLPAADSVALSQLKFIFLAMLIACPGLRPVMMSIGSLMMALGSSSAMSSIVTPPFAEATTTGPPKERSMRMAKYFSDLLCTVSTTCTVLQIRPPAPVCLVMSFWPSIFDAMSLTSSGVLMPTCTPPLKPFSKVPRPRPPARTWALMTMLSELRALAAAYASSAVLATPPLGVVTPCSLMMAADWYSWRLRFLFAAAA
mmetsp:Transcript_3298/g.7975  ORF Transcript_3298/g.7975 Transcript_3298/m.7975 type:complete len:350 (-) Transcript_3298:88-1137(-)